MKIKKSHLRKLVREHLTAFYVDDAPFASVRRMAGDKLEQEPGKNPVKNEDAVIEALRYIEDSAKLRMQAEANGVGNTGSMDEAKAAAKWYEAIKRPVKVGDRVHIGHGQKGGAGVEGIVTKIEGDKVHIKDPNPRSRRTWYGSLKKTAILEYNIQEVSGQETMKPNDPHTPEDEAEKDAADDVMEADPKKAGGRPRGAPHIDNERFWDLPERSLRFIIKDASEAIAANPMSRKASGKWADEVNDAVSVLHFRRKKGIKMEGWSDPKGVKQAGGWIKPAMTPETMTSQVEVGSLASNPKSKALIKKMHDLVTKHLKLKSIEDIQPLRDGVGFIFGDKKEAAKMANYLKKAGAFGKSVPLAAGGGGRTLVSLKLK